MFFLVLTFLPTGCSSIRSKVAKNKTNFRLTIELRDGSRLSGKSLADPLRFRYGTLGDLKLAVAGIRSIEMATDGETARLMGTNNDVMTVFFTTATLSLETSFGKIELPVKLIRSIKVQKQVIRGQLPAGLVALWSAEGNGTDFVGEHNAVPHGKVSFEPGVVGRSFGLDGHSAYLRIPASPDLDVGAGDGLTITAWIRPSTFAETPGNGARGPIIEWDSDTSDGVSIWANGDNSLMGHLKTLTADGRSTVLQTTKGVLRSGQWQLVAFTYDKNSGTASLYIDGVLVQSQNFGSVRPETTYPINIGRRTGQPVGNGSSFGGLVDELALYNRALSAAEIQDIYKSVSLIKHQTPQPQSVDQLQKAPPKLIGWWPLNEGEGTVAHDNSGNEPSHDGQVMGGNVFRSHPPNSQPTPNQFQNGQPSESKKMWDCTERGRESMVFDGRHYVSLGNIYQDKFEEITIACWIKNNGFGWQDVVERGSWGTADGIGLTMEWQGKSAAFGHYEQAVNSRANVQDKQWHHLAGTMRRSGVDYVYAIYVDGKLDNTSTNAWGLGATTGKWTIGARDGGSWNYRGLINDVRLYDGALTEAAIKKIYQEKKN